MLDSLVGAPECCWPSTHASLCSIPHRDGCGHTWERQCLPAGCKDGRDVAAELLHPSAAWPLRAMVTPQPISGEAMAPCPSACGSY